MCISDDTYAKENAQYMGHHNSFDEYQLLQDKEKEEGTNIYANSEYEGEANAHYDTPNHLNTYRYNGNGDRRKNHHFSLSSTYPDSPYPAISTYPKSPSYQNHGLENMHV